MGLPGAALAASSTNPRRETGCGVNDVLGAALGHGWRSYTDSARPALLAPGSVPMGPGRGALSSPILVVTKRLKKISSSSFSRLARTSVEQSGNAVVLRFPVLFRRVLICYVLTKQFKSAGESVVAAVEEAVFVLEWRSVPSIKRSLHRRSVVARVVRAIGHLSTEHREATANRDAASNVRA